MIERIELFETKGKQFKTVKAALAYREGLLEEFFRQTPGFQTITAKLRIPFIQAIIDNRSALADLLDYSDEV